MQAVVFALFMGLASASPAIDQASGSPEVLTNESVIAMSTANVNKDLLLGKINTTRNSFDVSVDGLINLYQAKVREEVVKMMISAAANTKLGPPAPKTPEVLDNQSVITMVGAKLPKAIVLAKIQSTKGNYDVSSTGLVALTQAKVPQEVIQAMMVK